MKKIVKLILLLFSVILISLCNVKNVYGVSSCEVNLFTERSEYKIGDEIVVYVRISQIQSEIGIFTGMMTLDYDKNSLELLKMEGQNSWDTPILNSSYNSDNGKLVITKSGFTKNDENILKITFKAITNNDIVNININDISFSDSNLIRLGNVSKTVTVKDDTQVIPEQDIPKPDVPEKSGTEIVNPEQDEAKTEQTEQNNDKKNEDKLSEENSNNQEVKETEQNAVIEEQTMQSMVYPVLSSDEENNTETNTTSNLDDSTSKLGLPKTGERNIILITSVIIFTICVIFMIRFGMGYIKNNKKIDNHGDDDIE